MQNPFEDARETAKGTIDGIAGSAIDLVDLCTHPNKIADTVRDAGDAIQTASNYYAHTSPEKVKQDAEEALRVAAAMPPYQRGKLCGELAFGTVLGEGICAAGKFLTTETVMLRSSSHEFEGLMRDISSPQQLPERLRLRPSQAFAGYVDDLVWNLPAHVRDLLEANHVRVVSLTDLKPLWPSLDHVNGIFSYGPENPTAIWLSENAHRANGVLDTKKLELTFRHEVAHATDCFAENAGWISDSEEMREMLNREILRLSTLERHDLWRTFSHGSERFLRQEIVAEIVSRTAVKRGTFRDELFRRMFPTTTKYLHAPDSPFLFDK